MLAEFKIRDTSVVYLHSELILDVVGPDLEAATYWRLFVCR